MKKITAIILTVAMLAMCFASYAAPFEDVGENFSWASESIEKFYAENIIQGKSEGIFAPDDSVTRAEFAKMLALTFGLEEKSENVYTDVGENEWYNEYIKKADGYTVAISVLDNSCAADMYAPDVSATRQEIAASLAMVVAENTPKVSDSHNTYLENTFVDYEDVNKEIYTLVGRAARSGLIQGYEDKTLKPNGSVTRAEAVVMLDRAREYIKEHAATPSPEVSPTPTATPSAEPTQKPTPTPTPTAVPASTPRPVQDLVSVVDVVMTSINSERYYSIYYAFGGVCMPEPIVAFEDASVWGVKTQMSQISCGDLILYELHHKGYANGIRVIYSPGDAAPATEENLETVVSVPPTMNWGLYNSGKNTQLYFGRIDDIDKGTNGDVVVLEYQNNKDQAFLLPGSGARISVYKPYVKSNEKRFESIDSQDISGNGYDVDREYVFVKLTREVVTDVIIIDYEK